MTAQEILDRPNYIYELLDKYRDERLAEEKKHNAALTDGVIEIVNRKQADTFRRENDRARAYAEMVARQSEKVTPLPDSQTRMVRDPVTTKSFLTGLFCMATIFALLLWGMLI